MEMDDVDAHSDLNACEQPTINPSSPSASTLRWRLLRQALLPRSKNTPSQASSQDLLSKAKMKQISRKPVGGFNLIPHHMIDQGSDEHMRVQALLGGENVLIEYSFPFHPNANITILKRKENYVDLRDLEICREHDIDNTGVVCLWPAEEVLTYYCINRGDMFRGKKILEIGSGYGLAGLAIAACIDAAEVVISDGNPQVVDYIENNIAVNACTFGNTRVTSLLLRWGKSDSFHPNQLFDFVIAADCTFFTDHHDNLAQTLKCLFDVSKDCQAIFFCPKRGSTLDLFLQVARNLDFHIQVIEKYDCDVWDLHQKFTLHRNAEWPNYAYDHSYPLLIIICMKDV